MSDMSNAHIKAADLTDAQRTWLASNGYRVSRTRRGLAFFTKNLPGGWRMSVEPCGREYRVACEKPSHLYPRDEWGYIKLGIFGSLKECLRGALKSEAKVASVSEAA